MSEFAKLIETLEKIPAVTGEIRHGADAYRPWWVEFTLDLNSSITWNVIQEISHILNYASYDEELVSVFKPVSPPPYKAGGPDDCLTWVIESKSETFLPDTCAVWLRNKLPEPIEDRTAWVYS